jgi:hypothetical protein
MTDSQTEAIDGLIYDATAWLYTLSQHDADVVIDTLLDRIIAVLRRDERMPLLTGEQWRLLFADASARSKDELGHLIDGKGDIDEAADNIAEALADKDSEKRGPAS